MVISCLNFTAIFQRGTYRKYDCVKHCQAEIEQVMAKENHQFICLRTILNTPVKLVAAESIHHSTAHYFTLNNI